MTTMYFIRHCEPDYTNHNDRERPLTKKGMKESKLVTKYLQDKEIDVVLSSPFVRAADTVKDYADSYGHTIHTIEDFRERKIANTWIDDYNTFSWNQWQDFNYKHEEGESLREVQERNMNALNKVLDTYKDSTIVIGTHGVALSMIVNHYVPRFGYEDFQRIGSIFPWIVKMTFEGEHLVEYEEVNIK